MKTETRVYPLPPSTQRRPGDHASFLGLAGTSFVPGVYEAFILSLSAVQMRLPSPVVPKVLRLRPYALAFPVFDLMERLVFDRNYLTQCSWPYNWTRSGMITEPRLTSMANRSCSYLSILLSLRRPAWRIDFEPIAIVRCAFVSSHIVMTGVFCIVRRVNSGVNPSRAAR